MCKAVLAVSVAVATVVGAGGGAGAASPGVVAPEAVKSGAVAPETVVPEAVAPGMVAPEADVAHHGYASLAGDRLEVLVLSRNHGPSGLEDATVRIGLSVPPSAVGQKLPQGCVRVGDREVLCTTGPLPADGSLHETRLYLRTAGTPSEVTVSVATAWNGGATDRDPSNDQHQVLVPATGDAYAF
ncbi:hypothetical protein GCM10023237_27320 [Streptomyces coeruleoprunus]